MHKVYVRMRYGEMHRFYSRIIGPVIVLVFLAVSCSQQTTRDFSLSVDNFYGVEGFTLHYRLSPTLATVVLSDDFGSPPKKLWETSLADQQRDQVISCLQALPMDRLKNEYINSSVDDGLQLTFRIRLHGQSERVIELKNRHQEDLVRVIDLINGLVHKDHGIRFDQGAVIVGSDEG